MQHRFRTLYPYLWRYRYNLLAGMVCLVAATYLEIRVAVLLGNGIDLIGLDLDGFTDFHLSIIHYFLLLTILIAFGGAVARFWMRRLIIGASRHIEYDFRNDFFRHLTRLSPSFYDRYRTGDLMSRSTGDLDAIRVVIGPCIMYMANTFTIVPLTLAQMVQISPQLMVMCWLPILLLIPLVYYFRRRIHRRFLRVQELMSDLSANIQESLSGVRVLKVYAREDDQSDRFEALSDHYVDANLRLAKLQAFFFPLLSLIVGLSILMLLWVGSTMIIFNRLTVGDLTTFYLLLGQSIWPIAAFGWVMAQLERGSASMGRVDQILNQQPDVPAQAATGTGQADVPQLQGRIEIRNLTFYYPNSAVPALVDMNLDVPPGTTLGLTGPVGCGKSTLAVLLARRYNPPRGTLFLDGKDILDWPVAALRRQIGIVDQEPFLFSDTITANIAFGLSNGVADPHQLDPDRLKTITRRAASIAQLDKDLDDMPDGYETILGERGINLSGGQRQRTALARALARDPQLLILDDALAAVDTGTEEAILRGLKEVLGTCTTILISHRVSTMSMADLILYMSEGRVIEQGSHEQLMARHGAYWALAQRQRLAEEIEETS